MKFNNYRTARLPFTILLVAAIMSLESAAGQGVSNLRSVFSRTQQQQHVAQNQQSSAFNTAAGGPAQMPNANAALGSMPATTTQDINNQVRYFERVRQFGAVSKTFLTERVNKELGQDETRAILQEWPFAQKQLEELIFTQYSQFESSLSQFKQTLEQTVQIAQRPARSFQLFSSPGAQLTAAWQQCMSARQQLEQQIQSLNNFIQNELPNQSIQWEQYIDGFAVSYAPVFVRAPAQQALQQQQQQQQQLFSMNPRFTPKLPMIPEDGVVA